jgi:hypothetical protein
MQADLSSQLTELQQIKEGIIFFLYLHLKFTAIHLKLLSLKDIFAAMHV